MDRIPSIGALVWYTPEGSGLHSHAPLAAIIQHVPPPLSPTVPPSGDVDLWVLTPDELTFLAAVPYDESGAAETWRWPE